MQHIQRILKDYEQFLIIKNIRPKRYLVQSLKIINKIIRKEKIQYSQYGFIKSFNKFLISSFSTHLSCNQQLFPTILILHNSILKSNLNLVVPYSKAFVSNFYYQFVKCLRHQNQPFIVQNALRLILKMIKGAYNKHEAFHNVMNSGIVWVIFSCKQSNQKIKSGIKLLLTMMLNFNQTVGLLIKFLVFALQNFQGNKNSICLIVSTIAETQLKSNVLTDRLWAKLLQCMQIYIKRQQIDKKQRILNYNIIAIRIYLISLQRPPIAIVTILKNILQDFDMKYLAIADKIFTIIHFLQGDVPLIKILLKSSILSLHNNNISRTIFVYYHYLLTKVQLINILTSSLPQDLFKLLNNAYDVHNCLKIVICLKMCVKKNGLQKIFEYSLKEVLQKIWANKSIYQNIPNILQLWQMLQQVFKDDFQKMNLS